MYSVEEVEEIRKETNKMFAEKHWEEMFFDEQTKMLKKDKKYNYIHCLLEISHIHDRVFDYFKNIFQQKEAIYVRQNKRLKEIINEAKNKQVSKTGKKPKVNTNR